MLKCSEKEYSKLRSLTFRVGPQCNVLARNGSTLIDETACIVSEYKAEYLYQNRSKVKNKCKYLYQYI